MKSSNEGLFQPNLAQCINSSLFIEGPSYLRREDDNEIENKYIYENLEIFFSRSPPYQKRTMVL